MKNRDDFIKSIYEKRDIAIKENKKKKKRLIMFSSLMAACLVLAIGIGSVMSEGLFYPDTEGDASNAGDGCSQNSYEEKVSDLEAKEDHFGIYSRLSFELFSNMSKKDQSTMISPLSIITVLSMIEEGARNESLAEMENALGMSAEDLALITSKFSPSPSSEKSKVKFQNANSLWLHKDDFKVNPDYEKNVKTKYNADVFNVVFDKSTVNKINQWCKSKTMGMVDHVVDNVDGVNLALLNAVAFDGSWEKPYDEFQVRKEPFYCLDESVTEGSLMYSSEDIYLENDLATGFIKPYEGEYEFIAILPKTRDFNEFIKKFSGKDYISLIGSSKIVQVDAVLPSFKKEHKEEKLVDILKGMGISKIFSPNEADLSGMDTGEGANLYIDFMIHKTFIEVNEKGTKAAAVTGAFAKTTGIMPSERYEVRLDRPFIYVICDSKTKAPIFIGSVTDLS